MGYVDKEKGKKRNNRRNRTIKLGKIQNTYNYLGLFKANTIKQFEVKEKVRTKNFLKPSSAVKILSKE